MQTINRQIASVAAKLTRKFFSENPNTEKTLSEVQKEMRRVAIEQIEADRVNAELDKIAFGEASGDNQAADFNVATVEFEKVDGHESFKKFDNQFSAAVIFCRKKDGAKVDSYKSFVDVKFGECLKFTLDNGKTAIVVCSAKELKKYYNLTAK